jgi:hypothetical protein
MQKKFALFQTAINQQYITGYVDGIHLDFALNFVYRLIFM